MRNTRWWGTIAVLALGIVLAAAATSRPSSRSAKPPIPLAAQPTIVQDDAELLHRGPRRTAANIAELRRMGVDAVRITAGWSVIAPRPGARRRPRFDATDPGAYPRGAWAKLDRAARLVQRAGMSLIVDIGFWAPRWAARYDRREGDRQRSRIDPRAFADFSEAVARRYSGRYRGLPAAAALTVWNEPNFGTFLMPQWRRRGNGRWTVSSAHAYRAMLMAAAPRIRRAAPRALMLIGATAPVGRATPLRDASTVPPLRFMRALACVDSRLEPLRNGRCRGFRPLPGDGWSHHPYSLELAPEQPDPLPDNVRMGDLPRMTALLARLHERGRVRSRMDVWITEYGFQTSPPDPGAPVTPLGQARLLARAERIARTTPGVRGFAQFLLRDLPARPGPRRRRWSDYQSGLRYADGRPKPALAAFKAPLVVTPMTGGTSEIWLRLRSVRGAASVRFEFFERDRWVPLGDPVLTAPDGSARVAAKVPAGARVRAVSEGGTRRRTVASSR